MGSLIGHFAASMRVVYFPNNAFIIRPVVSAYSMGFVYVCFSAIPKDVCGGVSLAFVTTINSH